MLASASWLHNSKRKEGRKTHIDDEFDVGPICVSIKEKEEIKPESSKSRIQITRY